MSGVFDVFDGPLGLMFAGAYCPVHVDRIVGLVVRFNQFEWILIL